MVDTCILLPPSEGKRSGGRRNVWSDERMSVRAEPERRAVIDALGRSLAGSDGELVKLFGVKGDALDDAIAANSSLLTGPTLAAIERYTGVLYDALDVASLTSVSRRRLNRQVLIFSGLWGVVAPSDPIPNYRLKMGASLAGIGKLASFWRPILGDRIDRFGPKTTLWNLLPNEHNAALEPPDVRQVFSAKFFDEVADDGVVSLRQVNHWNKLLKGALVRWILEAQPRKVDAVASFEHPLGYRWQPELDEVTTRNRTLVFVRPASLAQA